MENLMLNNISIFEPLDSQKTNGIGDFDLSDNRFSNILEEKIGERDKESQVIQNITSQLGLPIGLEIEGFNYTSQVNEISPDDMIEVIKTESNLKDDSRFDIVSAIKETAETFSPIIEPILDSQLNLENQNISNPVKAVKNFWINQASNFYSIMNKDTVNDITELIAKL